MTGLPHMTPGIGKKTDAHLNLTRSLAEVWAVEDATYAKRPLPVQRLPYAGKDRANA